MNGPHQKRNIIFLFTIKILVFLTISEAFPIDIKNGSRLAIQHKELLPPDHVPGAHIEQDGHINKDYHHEVFLGNLIKDGSLDFSNIAGYKNLIKIFHLVDVDKDHSIENLELITWIHSKILEHYNNAETESYELFKKVDHDGDNKVSWAAYKAQLLGLDPKKYEHDNTTIESDKSGEFFKEVQHWLNADENGDGLLTRQEFLAFVHPEHNKKTLSVMAKEFMKRSDHDQDGNISLEEFIRLPPGEVDPEEAELDEQYQRERTAEFKDDMDIDNDNIVTLKEIMEYLDVRHMHHAVKEAEYLIRHSDRNRDNKISEHEMLMQYELFTGSSLARISRFLHDEF